MQPANVYSHIGPHYIRRRLRHTYLTVCAWVLWTGAGSVAYSETRHAFSPSAYCASQAVERDALKEPLIRWRSQADASDLFEEASRCAQAVPKAIDLCRATGHAWLLSELVGGSSPGAPQPAHVDHADESRRAILGAERSAELVSLLEPAQGVCLQLRWLERGIEVARTAKRAPLKNSEDIWRLSELFWRSPASRAPMCTWLTNPLRGADGDPWSQRLLKGIATYCTAARARTQTTMPTELSLPPSAAMALLERIRLEESATARRIRRHFLRQDNPHVQRAALRSGNVAPHHLTHGYASVRASAACYWLQRVNASERRQADIDWRAARHGLSLRHRTMAAECAALAGECNVARILVNSASTPEIDRILEQCSQRMARDP